MTIPHATTYQGAPCRCGHDGTRYASNSACVECSLDRRRLTYDKPAEAAYKRAYRARKHDAAALVAAFEDLL